LDKTPKSYAEQSAERFGGGLIGTIMEGVRKFVETWSNEQLGDYVFDVGASNESSVVQMGIIEGRRIVLTGDAGPQALMAAIDAATQLNMMGVPDIFQIPHHGSRRNVTKTILNNWLGGPVVEGDTTLRGRAPCSIGDGQPEYPRRRVQNAFIRRGYKVLCTRSNAQTMYMGMPERGAGWATSPGEPFDSHYEE
jgi:hypothetical protein